MRTTLRPPLMAALARRRRPGPAQRHQPSSSPSSSASMSRMLSRGSPNRHISSFTLLLPYMPGGTRKCPVFPIRGHSRAFRLRLYPKLGFRLLETCRDSGYDVSRPIHASPTYEDRDMVPTAAPVYLRCTWFQYIRYLVGHVAFSLHSMSSPKTARKSANGL